jgi:uncharacterized protein YggE
MSKTWKKLSGIILVSLMIIGLAACSGQSSTSTAGDAQTRSLRVTGVGEASGAPDMAVIDLGVEQRGSDLGALVDQANQTLNDITAALESFGIDSSDIQTSQFNIRQDQPNTAEPTLESGPTTAQPVYVITATQRVRLNNLDQIGQAIQVALDAGANSISGLSFGLENPSDLQQQARLSAIADAQDRADQMAEALGLSLGDVISVSESGSGSVRSASNVTVEMAAGAPAIRQGQLSVSVSVEVVFAIE